VSPAAPIEPEAVQVQVPTTRKWHVRPAVPEDIQAVAAAVAALLDELAGAPQSTSASSAPAERDLSTMEGTVRALIENPQAGTLLVADAEGSLVGMLAASWQIAIHVPGRYGLIQDLWVPPSLRGGGIGAALVEAFAAIAREQGVPRIEVGLPKPSFAGIAATEAFYVRNGLVPHGTRMRMLLG